MNISEYKCNQALMNKICKIYFELAYITLVNENIFCTKDSTKELNNLFYIKYRIQDVLISITDDLIRYADYHKINTIERKNGEPIFDISEPVRATFFTKWILKIRPCIIDSKIPFDHEYKSSDELDKDFCIREIHKVEFCNEHLAMVATSFILNIKYADADEIVTYDKMFNAEEQSTLFYSLRYRVVHQDSYGFLYRKIFNNLYDGEEYKFTRN